MKSRPKKLQDWLNLSKDELSAATRQFDDPDYQPKSIPAPAGVQASLHKAVKSLKRGRPRVGAGSQPVLISLEKDLLKKADAFAEAREISRSQLIAEALHVIMRGGGTKRRKRAG